MNHTHTHTHARNTHARTPTHSTDRPPTHRQKPQLHNNYTIHVLVPTWAHHERKLISKAKPLHPIPVPKSAVHSETVKPLFDPWARELQDENLAHSQSASAVCSLVVQHHLVQPILIQLRINHRGMSSIKWPKTQKPKDSVRCSDDKTIAILCSIIYLFIYLFSRLQHYAPYKAGVMVLNSNDLLR